MKKNTFKKMFVNTFIYSWIICMLLFAIGCPIAAIGYALVGNWINVVISVVLGVVGIGGYTYLVTNEDNAK